MKGLTIILSILSVLAYPIFGQNTITPKVSTNYIKAGKPFYIQYEIAANDEPTLVTDPTCDGFKMTFSGQSHSISTTFINGNFSKSVKYILNYQCQPTKSGTFDVKPMVVKVGGKKIECQPFSITVGEGSAEDIANMTSKKIIAKVSVSKNTVYQGEYFSVYTRAMVGPQVNKVAQFQQYGMTFPKEIILESQSEYTETKMTNYNGVNYHDQGLEQFILRGGMTGTATLPSFEFDITYINRYNQFESEKVSSSQHTIDIKPLPKGAPDSFDNLVCKDLSLDVSYSKTSLKAGEAIDLVVTLSGTGNLNLADAPKIKFPTDFNVYDPEAKEKLKLTSSGYTGDKSFHYIIIPEYHGSYKIPELKYSYFDLNSETYITLTQPAQTIEVEKSATSKPATLGGNNIAKEEVEIINNEIRHISYDTQLKKSNTTFFGTGIFWTGFLSPFLLALGGFLFLRTRTQEEQRDQKKHAGKNVLKVLKEADKKLQENDNIGFYQELYKGLMAYLSTKLDTPLSSLNKESIVAKIDRKDLSDEILKVIEDCEMANYAPITTAGAKDTMNKAHSLIEKIEKYVA